MGVIWSKVWFDIWHNKLRSLLVIASISIGVFVIGVTFGMAELMLPAMDSAHAATNPAEVTLYVSIPLDRDTILALKAIPGIENVEGMNSVDIRYKKQPAEKWRKGSILVRDDYENQVYDTLQLKAGAWPEGRHIGIERMHSPFYGIDIGDQVILEIEGKERVFPITGKIRHPFVPPPSMYDWAWFFGSEELMLLYGIPSGKFTQIKFSVTPYSSENARLVASAVKERLAKQNVNVVSTLYQDPKKHWGRVMMDGITLVIKVIALLSLILSIVLVLNTITAVITQQTHQIGVMKAVGGSSFTISKIYLVGVLFFEIIALFIALPLGTFAAYSVSRWFLGLFNIDFDQYTYSNRVIILQVVSALIFPLAAALVPVTNGARITIQKAIASYGVGGDFGSSWLDRLIDRIAQRLFISYYAISITNTFRRKGRLILSQIVLVMAGVMFLMVMSLSSSITATLDREYSRRTHDIIISFRELMRVDRMKNLVDAIPGVEKSGMWLIAPVTILHEGQKSLDAGMGSQLQGVPVEDPMYTPFIVEGRWLQSGDGRAVVMNQQTAEDENLKVGDLVLLDLGEAGLSSWRIVGLYRAFLMFGGGFNIDAIYAPDQAIFDVTKKTGKGSSLLVRTQNHDPESVAQVAAKILDQFQQAHVEIYQTETMTQLRQTSDTSFGMIISMLLVLALMVAMVGGIGLMGSLWIGVIERTKEIGVMRAIGAVSSRIIAMFMLEGIFQGLLSWMLAIPLSYLVAPLMADALGQILFKNRLDFQYNWQAALNWLAIVLVISCLASIFPARKAARINVRESISYD